MRANRDWVVLCPVHGDVTYPSFELAQSGVAIHANHGTTKTASPPPAKSRKR